MDESLKYKWFYESLQRVNNVLDISEGIDKMLDDVVETVLDIFQSDRAWLFHPCDPEADYFDVTVESNKPHYPGAKSQQVSVPMTPDMADYCRRVQDKPGEVIVDPLPGSEISNDIALRFSVQSLIFMALHPKVGNPWMFGLHQCDHPREWSNDEKELFCLIGHRLEDVLSNKLFIERVSASEETLRQLAEASWEAIVVHVDGIPVLANDQYYTMFGYSPEELLGQPAMEMTTTPESLQQMRRLIAAGELGPYEAVGVCKDGSTFPMEIKAQKIRYQGKDVRVAAIRDVTRHKRVADELRRSQERLRAIFDSTTDCVFLKDVDLRYVKINSAMERLFGCSAQELEGRTDRELFGDEAGDHIEELDALVLRGETLEEEDTKPVNGKLRTFYVKKTPVYGSDGKVIGLCGIARDVTERKVDAERLSESEEKFAKAFQHAPMLMTLSSLEDGTLIDANEAWLKLSGYTREEAIGRSSVELKWLNEEQRRSFSDELVSQGQIRNRELVVMAKGGRPIHLLFNADIITFANQRVILVGAVDITERKLIEESQRDNYLRQKIAMDLAKLVNWEYDIEADLFTFDDQFYSLYGTSSSEQGGNQMSAAEYARRFLPPEEAPLVAREIQLAVEAEDRDFTRQLEHRVIRADGEERHFCVRFGIAKDENGRTIKTYGANQDITEQKEAEGELDASRRMYQQIFDNAAESIYIVQDARVVICNKKTEELTGYSVEEIRQLSISDFIHPDDKRLVLNRYHARLKGDKIQDTYDFRLITKSGDYYWVNLNVVQITWEGRPATLNFLTDINERKLVEDDMRLSEEKYRLLAETSSDIIILHDMEGRISYTNKACQAFTGQSESQLLGQSIFDFVPKSELANVQKRKTKRLSGENAFLIYETTYMDHTKESVPFEINSAPVIDQGKIQGVLIVGRDITERKRIESQLRQSQKMEAVGTLAGGIAHDFNNILAAIIGFTELTLEDTPASMPTRSNLEQILKSALRARDLVKQILSFSRQTEREKKPLMVEPIVRETLKLLRSTIPTTIDIRQEIASDIGFVEGDPTQVHQLFLNIGTNAADAMKATGGTLTVRLEDAQVDQAEADSIGGLTKGRYLKIEIQDTGPGIPVEIQSRIFDPFFTTKEVGAGTGMGLSVVHGIVQSLDGAIAVDSDSGQGALFTIHLPVVDAEAVQPWTQADSDLIKGTGRVLFVDDEEMVSGLGKLMLEKLGYTPTVKTSSLEALETFKANPECFDLVMTDMAMPKMNGATLAKEILAIRPNIPIILCTGYSDQIDEGKAERLGINRLLDKPLSISEVSLVIREVLDNEMN